MDILSDTWKVDRSFQNVLQACGKLMEGPVDAQKADGWSCDCTEICRKLTKGPAVVKKVDRILHGRTES